MPGEPRDQDGHKREGIFFMSRNVKKFFCFILFYFGATPIGTLGFTFSSILREHSRLGSGTKWDARDRIVVAACKASDLATVLLLVCVAEKFLRRNQKLI